MDIDLAGIPKSDFHLKCSVSVLVEVVECCNDADGRRYLAWPCSNGKQEAHKLLLQTAL